MSLLFVLDPCFGPWVAYPLLALLAAGLLADAVLHGAAERRLLRVLVRLALLIPLAIFLLRPVELAAEKLNTQPTVAVVFDSSKSLDLPVIPSVAVAGAEGAAGATAKPADAVNVAKAANGTHRRDAVELLHLRTIAPLLQRLPGHHEAWTINDSLHLLSLPPENITTYPACGGGSALGDGLSDLINGAAPARPGARCDAVVLYTDGAITRGRGWAETLSQLEGSPAPVFVCAVGDPSQAGPAAFALDRLQGPDRVNAGEEARLSAVLRAPANWAGPATLRLHWQVDGEERAVHELAAPQLGGLLRDEMVLPFSTPGLSRVTVQVEAPAAGPAVLPPQSSHLIAVEAKKIRVLFWSMRLSRQTRGIEEQLARDDVLSVNVAGDFYRGRGMNLENALRSADVIVWEDPDLARLGPTTADLLGARLKEGVGLILLSSPRLDLSKNATLLSALPAQAGAPWMQVNAKPTVPAELRQGGFFPSSPPLLPEFSGRLQQFDSPRDLSGYQAFVTTAEGQPILLAGHPGPNRSVVVVLTPDWPSDDETAAAASSSGAAVPALGLGSLIRHAVHWTAGAETSSSEPTLRLKLSDERPLPDQWISGSVELAHLNPSKVTTQALQLGWVVAAARPIGATPGAATTSAVSAPKPTPLDWQMVNGEVRFRLALDHPGTFLVQAHFTDGARTLVDQVALYVPGEELEVTEPPDLDHLRQLAETTGGRFVLAAKFGPDDAAALQGALAALLTPQPSVQVGRIALGGGGFTAGWVILCLLVEMTLRARRWW